MNTGRASRRSRLLTGLLVAAGVVAFAIGMTVRLADLHVQTVLSNSMQPTVSAGDVAITQGVPIDSLRVGDAIAFQPPNAPGPVLHRITSVRDGVITTRGDANPVDDPWRVTLRGTTGYRMVAVLPLVGWLTDLQRPALLAAGLLVGLAILLELRKEVRARVTRSQPQPDS
jgi:signal peptidase I